MGTAPVEIACSVELQQLVQKIGELLFPPGPIVIHVRAPDIHPAVDSLLLEHILEPAGAVQQLILPRALSHTEDKAVVVVHADVGMVRGHIGDEIHRRVVVHQVVHIPTKEVPRMVKTADGYDHTSRYLALR